MRSMVGIPLNGLPRGVIIIDQCKSRWFLAELIPHNDQKAFWVDIYGTRINRETNPQKETK